MTPIDEITNGAQTIEKASIDWGSSAGVAIKAAEWTPSIPPQSHSVPESYSLKLQSTLSGQDEMFDVFIADIPTEWLQDSARDVRPEAARLIKNAIADAERNARK